MPTGIQYVDEVWNPITGCSAIGDGCTNCWARAMAKRLGGRCGYPKDDPFRPTFHAEQLDKVKRWVKPRRVFVCSMGDIMHEDVPEAWIEAVSKAMRGNARHTYLLLTKRPERLRVRFPAWHWTPRTWFGVSVENQAACDERLPVLRDFPKVFVSYEPALGPVELWRYWEYLKWAIIGGESGRNARPCEIEWIEGAIDDCMDMPMPVYVKQLGAKPYFDGAPWKPERWTNPPNANADPKRWPKHLRVREYPERMR